MKALKCISILMIMLGLLSPWLLNAQDAKSLLFKDADEALKRAQEVQAEFYSPTQFAEGLKNYKQAEENYDKGRNLEDIRKKLQFAAVFFLKSVESAKLFHNNCGDCISAREDAMPPVPGFFRVSFVFPCSCRCCIFLF